MRTQRPQGPRICLQHSVQQMNKLLKHILHYLIANVLQLYSFQLKTLRSTDTAKHFTLFVSIERIKITELCIGAKFNDFEINK